MSGSDLIALAAHLVANTAFGNPEARYRSAISRAYYGAFHLTVSFLEEVVGANIPQNHTGHERAFRMLESVGVPAALRAADLLTALRTMRNRADYKLRLPGFDSRTFAQKWVEAALTVQTCLDECRKEPTCSQIRNALKSTSGDAS